MKPTRWFFSLIAVSVLIATAARTTAQTTTGTVTGLVTDPAGAFIAGVTVKLTNAGTGLVQTAASNESGSYVFPLVQPGAYEISVEKEGFQRFARAFTLGVTQQARIDVQLAVGQVSETVTVTAGDIALETESSNLGQVITQRQVVDLPLNGRNPFSLAALTPGVTPLASFGTGLAQSRGAAQSAGANNFLANGGMTGANEILLDGIPITVCCQGQPALIPTIDTTEEFKVQTSSSPAEFGRTSGGILNIVTKSVAQPRPPPGEPGFLAGQELPAQRSSAAPVPRRGFQPHQHAGVRSSQYNRRKSRTGGHRGAGQSAPQRAARLETDLVSFEAGP